MHPTRILGVAYFLFSTIEVLWMQEKVTTLSWPSTWALKSDLDTACNKGLHNLQGIRK
jgi:hypothetical protein